MISKLESYLDSEGINGKQFLRLTHMSRQRAYYLKNNGIKSWKVANNVATMLGCTPETIIGLEDGYGYRNYKTNTSLKRYF
jgi:hypothetical protein